ncbi:MAG: excinuclease ABC subunit C, partial [Dehalococcoidales bacterium]
ECYDISNVQGKAATGSMVVFEDGKPRRNHYRRFRIKTVTGADDYAMLSEVLRRRFARSAQENADTTARENAWDIMPDLVLIDGGKGQLNTALKVLDEMSVSSVAAASIAKANEEVFIPQQATPITLPDTSPARQLLQRIRDEAHRFAISYHRNIRSKEALTSVLDGIPGIGPKRKRVLLEKFGSVQGIREASVEELSKIKGITQGQARKIKEYL